MFKLPLQQLAVSLYVHCSVVACKSLSMATAGHICNPQPSLVPAANIFLFQPEIFFIHSCLTLHTFYYSVTFYVVLSHSLSLPMFSCCFNPPNCIQCPGFHFLLVYMTIIYLSINLSSISPCLVVHLSV